MTPSNERIQAAIGIRHPAYMTGKSSWCAMTFKERLTALGFGTYEAYLCSSHWKSFKKKYEDSERFKRCLVCGSFKVSLHHWRYTNLGKETIYDVFPLCMYDHKNLHDWLKLNRKYRLWDHVDIFEKVFKFSHEEAHWLAEYVVNGLGPVNVKPINQPQRLTKKERRKKERKLQTLDRCKCGKTKRSTQKVCKQCRRDRKGNKTKSHGCRECGIVVHGRLALCCKCFNASFRQHRRR